jgi:hypothetical protein
MHDFVITAWKKKVHKSKAACGKSKGKRQIAKGKRSEVDFFIYKNKKIKCRPFAFCLLRFAF